MSRTKMYQAVDKTGASFFSDPPFSFAAAKQGGIVVRCDNWAATTDELAVTVQWGEKTLGILGNAAAITWADDSTLTATITGAGGTTVEVVGFIKIPQMASKYMRLKFALSGAGTPEADIVAWFNWQSK